MAVLETANMRQKTTSTKDRIRVMSIQHGDEFEEYDPSIIEDVDRIKAFIRAKIADGFKMYHRPAGSQQQQEWMPLKAEEVDSAVGHEIILGRAHEKMMAPSLKGG